MFLLLQPQIAQRLRDPLHLLNLLTDHLFELLRSLRLTEHDSLATRFQQLHCPLGLFVLDAVLFSLRVCQGCILLLELRDLILSDFKCLGKLSGTLLRNLFILFEHLDGPLVLVVDELDSFKLFPVHHLSVLLVPQLLAFLLSLLHLLLCIFELFIRDL